MFENTRTHSKARELKGFSTESEAEAKTRLSAQGWSIPESTTWDDKQKKFTLEKAEEEDGDES